MQNVLSNYIFSRPATKPCYQNLLPTPAMSTAPIDPKAATNKANTLKDELNYYFNELFTRKMNSESAKIMCRIMMSRRAEYRFNFENFLNLFLYTLMEKLGRTFHDREFYELNILHECLSEFAPFQNRMIDVIQQFMTDDTIQFKENIKKFLYFHVVTELYIMDLLDDTAIEAHILPKNLDGTDKIEEFLRSA